MQIVPLVNGTALPATPGLGTAAALPGAPTAAANAAATTAASDAALRSAFSALLGAMTRQRPAGTVDGAASRSADTDESVTRESVATDTLVAGAEITTVPVTLKGPQQATHKATTEVTIEAMPEVMHDGTRESTREGTREGTPAAAPGTSSGTSDVMSAPLAAIREFVLAQASGAPLALPSTPLPLTPLPPMPADHADVASSARAGAPVADDAGAHANVPMDIPLTATDALRPVRDLAALHPQLRIRVERIVTRMAQEHGHEVRVIETLRSQARQEHLHAQGRTRPGEIVTWTKHSKHTEGLAADLQVDGSWSDTEAYARLQRIAQEEGLHTLGPRDLGHVELRLSPDEQQAWKALAGHAHEVQHRAAIAHQAGPSGAEVPGPGRAGARPVAGALVMGGLATRVATAVEAVPYIARVADVRAASVRVAAVAQVAHVAQVAQVAEVAQVAQVAHMEHVEHVASVASPTQAAAPEITHDMAAMPVVEPTYAALMPTTGDAPRAAAPAATDTTLALLTSDRAERIEQIQDARASRPLQSLTLRVADANGTDHRIRVDLRGGQVVTDIALADPARATSLMQRLPELAQRLTEHGYEAGAMQVRALSTEPLQGFAPSSARAPHEERHSQQGHSQHHSQSRQRGRRESGGDTP